MDHANTSVERDPTQQQFWDQTWQNREVFELDVAEFRAAADVLDGTVLDLMGDLSGKEVLDLGCGAGHYAVYAAKKGATVTAVDTSQRAVEATLALAAYNRVQDRVVGHQLNALELRNVGKKFDVVIGSYILHHVEPFGELVDTLWDVMKAGGRGIFRENSARNKILMWARRYVAGRMGVPKYGDEEEHPLEAHEIEALGKRFAVTLHYPTFIFFRKVNIYIFRNRRAFRWVTAPIAALDKLVYRVLPPLRKYSYDQIVEFSKPG